MSKQINLALQGGGAHGAFTWGALEVLLEDDDIEIAAISGTSAGALNGAALKAGMVAEGRDGALRNLAWLWETIGASGDQAAMAPWIASYAPSAAIWAKLLEYSPGYTAFDLSTRLLSPYVYGPMLRNPLEDIVSKFHYDAVCAPEGPELHICATNVRSGKIRVFTGTEISTDAILASACLPSLFQAVEFKDPKTNQVEAFWDGGYTGNPALFPLFDGNLPADILIININPLHREDLPRDSQAIANRINEISFNSSLLRELRAIEFVQRLLRSDTIKQGDMKSVLVHMIADDQLMNQLNVATKTIPVPAVLDKLRLAGREATKKFLNDHKTDLNKNETVNLRDMFS